MERFQIKRTPDGDRLYVHKTGPELLRYPLYNKGTGFTPEERRRLGIEGLLPAEYNDIETQAKRIFQSIYFNHDDVGRNIGLAMLQDRNEVLFYKVLSQKLEEVMPIVYTPTVGKASQYYSRVFRRSRGIFITPEYRGRIARILDRAAPFEGVRLMVVTDNESILGIGDQGAGGMAISVGKLALYCAAAGIHPARTLPISLDVGTDNEDLLEDPLYLGYRQKRLRGDAYIELVDEFVDAANSVFPGVIIQWEDFRKDNALMILERYRRELPSFNDDIQGTGAVAAAAVRGACRVAETNFAESRILIYGAGAAGLGIARQLKKQLAKEGLTGDALTGAILPMDSRGIVSASRERLDDYKKELAWPEAVAAELALDSDARKDLAKVVAAYKPTAIIGASGQGGAFDENVMRAMAACCDQPIVLPMSNPTSISEGRPADILNWTEGRALIATGSPFEAVQTSDGLQPIGQANNVFVFPGIGLGAMVVGATEITNSMIASASAALAASLNEDDIRSRRLVPEVARLWDVCGDVALAVAGQAIDEGVARMHDTDVLEKTIASKRWQPAYPQLFSTMEPG